jgi:peptidoglycan/LPS O-acetylase OafA/YrhL
MGRILFLDGLRGWAALAVVLGHLFTGIFASYAAKPELIYHTPLLAMLDGASAVLLFFIISGFSLSVAFFRNGNVQRLLNTAQFRILRLYVPVAISVLFALSLLQLGLMSNGTAAELMENPWLANYYKDDSLGSFLHKMTFLKFTAYNPVLWSMKLELIASMTIFSLLAIAGKRGHRYILYIALAIVSLATKKIYLAFVIGVAIADLYVALENSKMSPFFWPKPYRQAVEAVLLIAFLIVYQSLIVPRYEEYHGMARIAAMTLLFLIPLSGGYFQELLASTQSRFMGRMSFALYLVHFPILCSLSCDLILLLRAEGWQPNAIIGTVAAVTIASCLAASLIFTTAVEEWLLPRTKQILRLGHTSRKAYPTVAGV